MIRTVTKLIAIILVFYWGTSIGVHGQETPYIARTSRLAGSESLPNIGIKTNLLYGLSATFNLGLEVRLSDYLSLDISAGYNPWTFSENKKLKHILVQPALRYWIYEPFNGHFLEGHLLYNRFNVGGLDLPLNIFSSLKDYRYDGNAYGIGFSYGYQWILSPRWNMEASFGFGYQYIDYTKYHCHTCGERLGKGSKHYWGPTRTAISLIYIIK